jgi:hypothetical protein
MKTYWLMRPRQLGGVNGCENPRKDGGKVRTSPLRQTFHRNEGVAFPSSLSPSALPLCQAVPRSVGER